MMCKLYYTESHTSLQICILETPQFAVYKFSISGHHFALWKGPVTSMFLKYQTHHRFSSEYMQNNHIQTLHSRKIVYLFIMDFSFQKSSVFLALHNFSLVSSFFSPLLELQKRKFPFFFIGTRPARLEMPWLGHESMLSQHPFRFLLYFLDWIKEFSAA